MSAETPTPLTLTDGRPLVAETVPSPPRPVPTPRFAAFQSRNFRLLWFGLFVSNAGTWMSATGEGWLVTGLEPGRAAFWLGLISASFAVPMLILPPLGGAVSDRLPRIRLLWTVQALYLLVSSVLAVLTLTGHVRVWTLVIYAFLNGVILAFDSPVRHALLPEIVTREQLPSGISLNSVAFTGAALIGPALGGVLIPIIGVGGLFTVNAASCVATLVAMSRFRGMPERATRRSDEVGVFRSIAGGIAFVRATPPLGALIALSTLSGLFARSYGPFLAVFARDVFGVGSVAFGALVAAGGLGTLVGAFWLASRTMFQRKGLVVLLAVAAQSSLLMLFAVSGHIAFAVVLLALAGGVSAIAGALTSTIIQLSVPNELRGRVMSLYLLTVVGVPSIGAFIIGGIASVANVRVAVGCGAAIVLVGTSVMALRVPILRRAN